MAVKTVSLPQTASALQEAHNRAEKVIASNPDLRFSVAGPIIATFIGAAFPTFAAMVTLYSVGEHIAVWQRIENRQSLLQQTKMKTLAELDSQPELQVKMGRVFQAQENLLRSVKDNNMAATIFDTFFGMACLNASFASYRAAEQAANWIWAAGAASALGTGFQSVENTLLQDAKTLQSAVEDAELALAQFTSKGTPVNESMPIVDGATATADSLKATEARVLPAVVPTTADLLEAAASA